MRLAGAIDIGASFTKLGVVSEDGRVVERATIPTNPHGKKLVADVAASLRPVIERRDVTRTGVSIAGFLDRGHTTMTVNSNLPGLAGFPLQRSLESALGCECALEVDSNAAVIAEHRFGAGRGSRRLLGITVGTGLGGGAMLDGCLLRYTGECLGDVGHIILDPEGRPCTCGARGCLEALVCTGAISERAGGKEVREVVAGAKGGDAASVRVLADTGRWLGIGLASLAPLYAPDTIVIGGGVAAAGDLLLEPTHASYRQHAGHDYRDARLVLSALDGSEGMIGAASLVFQAVT